MRAERRSRARSRPTTGRSRPGWRGRSRSGSPARLGYRGVVIAALTGEVVRRAAGVAYGYGGRYPSRRGGTGERAVGGGAGAVVTGRGGEVCSPTPPRPFPNPELRPRAPARSPHGLGRCRGHVGQIGWVSGPCRPPPAAPPGVSTARPPAVPAGCGRRSRRPGSPCRVPHPVPTAAAAPPRRPPTPPSGPVSKPKLPASPQQPPAQLPVESGAFAQPAFRRVAEDRVLVAVGLAGDRAVQARRVASRGRTPPGTCAKVRTEAASSAARGSSGRSSGRSVRRAAAQLGSRTTSGWPTARAGPSGPACGA